jgi:type II secretory pathway pseudopilin PulG
MFLKKLGRKRLLGFTLIEVMAVSGIMSSMNSQGNYQYIMDRAREMSALNNLRQIHMLLQMQSMGGGLPTADFFPKGDPLKDPKSIVRQIQGAPKDLFVSPFSPEGFRRQGLTYAWNDTVNGRELDRLPKDTWLLIDVSAFIADPQVPKPPKYLVLYADGRTEALTQIPDDILKLVAEAQEKLKSEAPPK